MMSDIQTIEELDAVLTGATNMRSRSKSVTPCSCC